MGRSCDVTFSSVLFLGVRTAVDEVLEVVFVRLTDISVAQDPPNGGLEDFFSNSA